MSNLKVAGVEVVQTIQDPKNPVKLISGKRTFVRVYLSPQTEGEGLEIPIRGELTVTQGTEDVGSTIHSAKTLLFRGYKHPSAATQRLHWSRSLNFELPWGDAEWKAATQGTTSLRVKIFDDSDKGDGADPGASNTVLTEYKPEDRIIFRDAPELRLRMLVFRYIDDESGLPIEPGPAEVEQISDFVKSTFPVAKVTWRSVTVEAASAFQQIVALDQPTDRGEERIERALSGLLRQALAFRNEDIYASPSAETESPSADKVADVGTLYLGVLADPTAEFGGAALDSPQHPAPHTVAVAAADYTGEIGAHELGHVLGRGHPGYPERKRHGRNIGQREEDPKYPYELGLISGQRKPENSDSEQDSDDDIGRRKEDPKYSNDLGPISGQRKPENSDSEQDPDRHLGLDTRRGMTPPQVLRSDRWFDLMTYREPKWISKYTYEGIHDRLVAQQERETSGKFTASDQNWRTVIGEFDLDRVTGKIWYVLPTRYKTPQPCPAETEGFPIKIGYDSENGESNPKPIYVRSPSATGLTPTFGVFQYTLEPGAPLTAVRLLIQDREVDRYGESKEVAQKVLGKIQTLIADSIGYLRDAPSLGPLAPARKDVFRPVHSDSPERPASSVLQGLDSGQPALNFVYDVASDGYYLRFRWPVSKVRTTTTLQCKRPPGPKGDNPWETVAVTNSHAKDVWISPEFFRPKGDSTAPDPLAVLTIADRANLCLDVRVRVTVGFEFFEETITSALRPQIVGPLPTTIRAYELA